MKMAPTGSREPCLKKPEGHAESALPFAGSPGKAALSIHRWKLKQESRRRNGPTQHQEQGKLSLKALA